MFDRPWTKSRIVKVDAAGATIEDGYGDELDHQVGCVGMCGFVWTYPNGGFKGASLSITTFETGLFALLDMLSHCIHALCVAGWTYRTVHGL